MELRTKEVCEVAVKYNGDNLEACPIEHIDMPMCLSAVTNQGRAIQFVPKKFLNDENDKMTLYCAAVQNNGLALSYINKVDDLSHHISRENFQKICQLAVRQNGMALMSVPERLCDEDFFLELCKEAVQNNVLAIQFVPKRFHDNTTNIFSIEIYQKLYAKSETVFADNTPQEIYSSIIKFPITYPKEWGDDIIDKLRRHIDKSENTITEKHDIKFS